MRCSATHSLDVTSAHVPANAKLLRVPQRRFGPASKKRVDMTRMAQGCAKQQQPPHQRHFRTWLHEVLLSRFDCVQARAEELDALSLAGQCLGDTPPAVM